MSEASEVGQPEGEVITGSVQSDGLDALARLLTAGHVAVLSGAGVSTESGIPDYRGPSSRARPARPIRYQEFVGSAEARARYWARSAIGWPRITQAAPNKGHAAIARLEAAGIVLGVITQNVDGLH
jgi:NAD-dependent SIR2 family protein deacetylase